jgi:hypothetical protein
MDQNSVVKLDIKVCKLDYPIELKEMISKCDYRQEVDFLVGYEPRNRFIADLTSRCKGVTLVLYTYIEKHGEILYKLIKEYAPEREVRFIHGGVDVENREEVRTLAENDPECIIIASS